MSEADPVVTDAVVAWTLAARKHSLVRNRAASGQAEGGPRLPAPLHDADDPARLIPKLRLSAHLQLRDPGAADRLVQATLSAAIEDYANRPAGSSLSDWLRNIFRRQLASEARRFMN